MCVRIRIKIKRKRQRTNVNWFGIERLKFCGQNANEFMLTGRRGVGKCEM